MGREIYFFNTFTDFNYLAPLVLRQREAGQQAQLVFFLEDLKRPTKTFFQESREDLMNFGFVQSHEVLVLESWKALEQYFRSFSGRIVSTTPTLHHLVKRHRLVSDQWERGRVRLVGLDYLGEYTGDIITALDVVFLSSPIWNNHYPPEKVRYGLPYWDLFGDQTVGMVADDGVEVDASMWSVVIPEIIQDQDTWFDACFDYIDSNYRDDTQFYLKYRLKTKPELERNRQLEARLREKGYANITPVYSPYFFTTVKLLTRSDRVVLTSNASLIIFDCMAAGATIRQAYAQSRSGIWADWLDERVRAAADEYIATPDEARTRYIANLGESTLSFFREVSRMYANEGTPH